MSKTVFLRLALAGAGIITVIVAVIISFFILKEKHIDISKIGTHGIFDIVKHFPFSKESCLTEWEEKILKKKVVYVLEQEEVESYVRADSEKAASALYYKIKLSINKNPVISWRWRVDKFPERKYPETLSEKKEEDFAARVYVMFSAAFFTKSKVVEYVWAETLPQGTDGTSGYSKNIKLLVLQTGDSGGEWRFEKRNIYEDYVKLFGEIPRLDISAIAFMTDADSTKTSASAIYDEIKIGYKEEGKDEENKI